MHHFSDSWFGGLHDFTTSMPVCVSDEEALSLDVYSYALNTIAIAAKTKEELEQDTKNAATKGGILERGVEYFYEVIESELGNQAFSAACDHPISSGYWETLRSQVCSLSREAYERSLHLTSH